ncbi:N-acetylmuramoyl-L-alanine amidase [Clostridium sp. MSJ-4]|uniref:N-acetylmuramoyl-L-alanine amidase n=1 Tax=Clostridium simiarum TaxID=2841506 RepID=A0ABS6EZ84_9CLOT|nr:N-acetylmuramoyl-L-alanine amidase [Clostridium simiarum]MBU5591531.1 N-acetylmuramoyl-L-alanine amidase [Clostridium simiarum]
MKKKSCRNRKRVLIKIYLVLISLFIVSLMFVYKAIDTNATNYENKAVFTKNDTKHSNNNSNLIVCIDPGHGGYDNGTKSSSGILEKDITLNVALEVGKILEENGIKVIYTRTSDSVQWPSNEKLDLRERVKISNDAKADIFVSIHCNGDKNASYKGVETWCRFPNSQGENLAKNIQKELTNANYTTDRGLKYESNRSLAVLKLNNSVSALVELGFLSNSSDAKFITSKVGQAQCSEALAKAILNYALTFEK